MHQGLALTDCATLPTARSVPAPDVPPVFLHLMRLSRLNPPLLFRLLLLRYFVITLIPFLISTLGELSRDAVTRMSSNGMLLILFLV